MADASSFSIVLLGYTVLGLAGFGSALTIVPLLAWKWPLSDVVVLVLLLDLPAALLHSGLNWRHVQFSELRRLVPGMVAGIMMGLWLARLLESRWPLFALGIYVSGVGLWMLRAGRPQTPLHARWGLVFGTGIGVVEVLFGTAGPLIATWMSRRISDPQQLRASIPVVVVMVVLSALTGLASNGRLSSTSLWQTWSFLLLAALGGVWLGHTLSRFVPATRLRQIICALLIWSGLALAFKSWM